MKNFLGKICRRPRGFTLVEALLTIALIALILGFVANICNEYARIIKFSTKKDKTVINAQMASERVKNELAEAVSILLPADGTSSSELRFERIDPCNASRLPENPSPTPASWNPADSSWKVTVRYYVEDQTLFRESTSPGRAAVIERLADGIAGFSCSSLSEGAYQINASYLEDNNVVKALNVRLQARSRW
jgi:prepilin-type N-terminal cleavage/methylation domain-containing protein